MVPTPATFSPPVPLPKEEGDLTAGRGQVHFSVDVCLRNAFSRRKMDQSPTGP
jgi:hypothetical protein